jgi:8-amino-7-oxononanoate synthase
MPDPLSWIDAALRDLDARALRRRLNARGGAQGPLITIDGREYINFGANDYLGLASDPRLAAAVAQASQEFGWGAGASPLVTGRSALHERLERRIAEFEGTEAALLFNTGFSANSGVIPALVGEGDVIFSDALNHASLIDGCRLSRAAVQVYRHNDCEHLNSLLREASGFRRRLIVTDSLFSMDGDLAPLPELCQLAERFDCMLHADEAHATGVFGKRGRGVAEHLGVEDRVHVRVGTLSKALGASGGFVAGGQALIDWLANRARSYVFSTAPPPPLCAAALDALNIVEREPETRTKLLATAAGLRDQLRAAGWNIGSSASQIIPIILGDAERALAAAAKFREHGIWVPAIRPPTVPVGKACLRISLAAGHTPGMLAELLKGLARA